MIHTFELTKMISKQTFENIISSLNMKYYKRCWISTDYADKGFTFIRTYKFKRKDIQIQTNEENDLTYYYMIAISINPGIMFHGDSHLSNNILSFTPDYVKAIYYRIYDLIPCMEQVKHYHDSNFPLWFELNAFKAHRIDYCFDLKTMHHEYLKLIDRGYSLRKDTFSRSYFDNKEILETKSDDEPDIPDTETLIPNNTSDVNYVYFKSKGININIYLKEDELKRRNLSSNPELDYDYLRIETHAKKSKLNAIVTKLGLKGRELQYLATPEVEEYILNSYIHSLTGTGVYVTLDTARKIISQSKYKRTKKQKLIKVVESVSTKHGIAKLLEQVENGTITDLGSLKTVKNYLREIQKELGINPVTISTTMNVPKQTLVNLTGGNDISDIMLPSLTDILKAYNQQIVEEQQQGVLVTQEVLEQIDKIQ